MFLDKPTPQKKTIYEYYMRSIICRGYTCGSDVIHKYKFIILSCFRLIRMARNFLATPRLDCLTSHVAYKFINLS